MALIFFLLFLIILNALFPSGTSLKVLARSKIHSLSTDREEAEWRQLLLAVGKNESNLAADRKLMAIAAKIHKSLKRKPTDSLIWQDVKEGAILYDRDTVQTTSRSLAAIQFDDGSILGTSHKIIILYSFSSVNCSALAIFSPRFTE